MPSVTSSSYIVMSGSTSEKVIEKYSTRKMQPGCMTLLMTAMITIDNMYNDQELTNTVKITEKLAGYGDEYREGETISVGDLLNAMLTGGSGQAAEALASYSATKRKIFIREMNSKALALGLLDTHFANPSGSWSTKQYSTAADCAVIMQAAMRYPLIREAFSLKTAETAALTGKQQRTVNIRSVNPLIAGKPSELYSFSQGGISGSLGEPVNAAQYAGAAVIDDMQLIVILMDSDSSKLAYEAKGLLDYADTKVTRNTIVKADKHVGNVRVRGGSITRVAAYTASKGFAYVPPEGSTDLVQTETVLFTGLEAPLKEGDKVGEFRISVADELKGTVDLVIKRDVPKGWFLSGFYISNAATVLIGVFIFLILALVLRILAVRRRRRRLRALRRERKIRELALQQMKMDEDRRKRNWYYSSSYEKFPPRTGDLRREALERAAAEQEKKR